MNFEDNVEHQCILNC